MLVLKGLALIWGLALIGFICVNGPLGWVSFFVQTPLVAREAWWDAKNRKGDRQ